MFSSPYPAQAESDDDLGLLKDFRTNNDLLLTVHESLSLCPWTIPCDVTIKADSLALTLLFISRPVSQNFTSCPFSHLSDDPLSAVIFQSVFSVSSSSSPCPSALGLSNPFTFSSLSSWIVPLNSLTQWNEVYTHAGQTMSPQAIPPLRRRLKIQDHPERPVLMLVEGPYPLNQLTICRNPRQFPF